MNFTLVSSLQACFLQIKANWTSLIFFTIKFTRSWLSMNWNPVTYQPTATSSKKPPCLNLFRSSTTLTSWTILNFFAPSRGIFLRKFYALCQILRMRITSWSGKFRLVENVLKGEILTALWVSKFNFWNLCLSRNYMYFSPIVVCRKATNGWR